MICFIIYCLNCIRHGRNATCERGLTVNATGLPTKYLQSISLGIKPVLKSSFDHFDRSTFPLFDAERISKSSTNFIADVPSPFRNKLWKDLRISLDTTSPGKIFTAKKRMWPLAWSCMLLTDRIEIHQSQPASMMLRSH